MTARCSGTRLDEYGHQMVVSDIERLLLEVQSLRAKVEALESTGQPAADGFSFSGAVGPGVLLSYTQTVGWHTTLRGAAWSDDYAMYWQPVPANWVADSIGGTLLPSGLSYAGTMQLLYAPDSGSEIRGWSAVHAEGHLELYSYDGVNMTNVGVTARGVFNGPAITMGVGSTIMLNISPTSAMGEVSLRAVTYKDDSGVSRSRYFLCSAVI